MKFNLYKVAIIYSLSALIIGVFLPIGNTKAASDTSKEIDIATKSADYLFNIDNMKPGDWASRTLTIQNNGNRDFHYTVKARRVSGADKLYNQLKLQVSDSNGVLYNGGLSGLKSFDPRFLASFDEEKLEVTVRFPEESGNEFQGLAVEIALDFAVEDDNHPNETSTSLMTTGGGIPSDGNPLFGAKLPKTANPAPLIFALAGLFLVLTGLSILALRRSTA